MYDNVLFSSLSLKCEISSIIHLRNNIRNNEKILNNNYCIVMLLRILNIKKLLRTLIDSLNNALIVRAVFCFAFMRMMILFCIILAFLLPLFPLFVVRPYNSWGFTSTPTSLVNCPFYFPSIRMHFDIIGI